MAISKTKVNERMRKKTNSLLAEAIFMAKKGNLELAAKLSAPSRKKAEVNVGRLGEAKTAEVIVPGKVLGAGEISKKMTVYAMSFSGQAEEKLKKAGCSCVLLNEALKKNPKLKGEIMN